MIFTHSFAGVLTTKAVLNKKESKLNKTQIDWVWFAGILGAILPDFDLVYVLFHYGLHHRYLPTHSLFPYLFLLGVSYLFAYMYRKFKHKNVEFFKTFILALFLGVLSHLIIDYFVGGLVFLWPFSKTYLGYPLYYSTGERFWIMDYINSYYIYLEIALMLVGISIMPTIKNLYGRLLPFLFVIPTIIGTIIFAL